MANNSNGAKSPVVPTDGDLLPAPVDFLNALLGQPVLLASESRGAYDALYRQTRSDLKPIDITEEILVRQYTDLVWEGFRLKRLQAKFFETARPAAVQSALEPMFDSITNAPVEMAAAWAKGTGRGRKQVEKILARSGIDAAALDAIVLSERIGDFERVERLITNNERRQAEMLGRLEQRREWDSIRATAHPNAVAWSAAIGTGPAS
jgi:hypothetical protein